MTQKVFSLLKLKNYRWATNKTQETNEMGDRDFLLLRLEKNNHSNETQEISNECFLYVGNIPLVYNQWTKSIILFGKRVYFRACSKTTLKLGWLQTCHRH